MGDPVQEQEFVFWDFWQKSQGKASMDTDTAPSTEACQADATPHPEEPSHKYPRPSTKGGGNGRGRGSGKRQTEDQGHDRGQGGWKDHRQNNSSRIAHLEAQALQLSRITLRHEDSLPLLCAEVSFVMHAKISPPTGVVKALFNMQQQWRGLREKTPRS